MREAVVREVESATTGEPSSERIFVALAIAARSASAIWSAWWNRTFPLSPMVSQAPSGANVVVISCEVTT